MKISLYASLFSGVGGFEIALCNTLDQLSSSIVFSSENDPFARKTYNGNHRPLSADDITDFPLEDIPDHHILTAGFPCQSFSIAGKREGFEDERGSLVFTLFRAIRVKRPPVFILENVSGLLSHQKGETFTYILSSLRNMGYTVFHTVLNSKDFGVPQNRKRVYIVGFHNDAGVSDFTFPPPLNKPVKLSDILEDDVPEKYFLCPSTPMVLWDTPNIRPNRLIRLGHTGKGGQGERIYSPEGLSVTLSAHSGGRGGKTGLYLINGRVRKLTPRECFRLQGFPDSFVLPCSDSQSYKQAGNAVTVPVVEAIVHSIINHL